MQHWQSCTIEYFNFLPKTSGNASQYKGQRQNVSEKKTGPEITQKQTFWRCQARPGLQVYQHKRRAEFMFAFLFTLLPSPCWKFKVNQSILYPIWFRIKCTIKSTSHIYFSSSFAHYKDISWGKYGGGGVSLG